ncbi:unannotated protein [freshwater metagenome]|uniref:Unannotated protein n=1 Tax=freshwater metagenome TaxID=449393 RepID=A0A6J7UMP9_9ZZZZ|nr:hypothetical protein [Actinomycetota bacterium]
MSDDSAAVLMRLLPPVSWNDFATKQDLETLGNFMQLGFNNSLLDLRNEMRKEFVDETGILRNGMQDEVASLRKEMQSEFAVVHKKIQDEFSGLRKEMYTEFSALRSEMNAGFLDLRKEMNNQTHRMFMAMLGINTLLMSVAIAAFKLL